MKLKMAAIVGLAGVVLYLLVMGLFYVVTAVSYYGDLGFPPGWIHASMLCPCCSTVLLCVPLAAFFFAFMNKADKLDP